MQWRKVGSGKGRKTKSIKTVKHKDYGYNEICFRSNFQPTSVSTIKILISGVAKSRQEQALPDSNSRVLTVIQFGETRAKIFPPELDHQMFGLGFQPILILIGGTAGKNGELNHGFEEGGCLADAERDDAKI